MTSSKLPGALQGSSSPGVLGRTPQQEVPGEPVAHPRFPLKGSFKQDIDVWV